MKPLRRTHSERDFADSLVIVGPTGVRWIRTASQ